MDAPAKEIAIGRKISDFATASPRRRRSASVANNKPMLTAANGTTMIHNAVFLIDRQHVAVAEDEPEVVEPDEAVRPRVLERGQDRVEDGVDEEHREDHEARTDEHVGPYALTQLRREQVDDLVRRPIQEEHAPHADRDRDADDQEAVRGLVAEQIPRPAQDEEGHRHEHRGDEQADHDRERSPTFAVNDLGGTDVAAGLCTGPHGSILVRADVRAQTGWRRGRPEGRPRRHHG